MELTESEAEEANMAEFGAPEMMIILLVVVLVFGGSKMADLGGSLGKGIKDFKKALKEDEPATTVVASEPQVETPAKPVATVTCPQCSWANPVYARLCNQCGARLQVSEPVKEQPLTTS